MKILYVTTIGATMSFFEKFIQTLINDGHTVDIATNNSISKIPEFYKKNGCKVFALPCSRYPINKGNLISIGIIRDLVKKERYDIVHCHTPIAAACTRLACRKLRKTQNLKVFYTAHGFHFYNGAPKVNWLIYYPIEKICAKFTDKLITINKEDYARAKKNFKAKEVCYVPGVGIDLSEFDSVNVSKNKKRKEIGVPKDAFLLFSVGELNENKNHQIVIKALSRLQKSNVHYVIAGKGEMKNFLLELAQKLGVYEQVHLIGYRNDIKEINSVSDAFCFPSFREGLSVSLMEAMASGLPIVCSNIRGNVDLINEDNGVLFDPYSDKKCEQALSKIIMTDTAKMSKNNKAKAVNYSINKIILEMKKIYGS